MTPTPGPGERVAEIRTYWARPWTTVWAGIPSDLLVNVGRAYQDIGDLLAHIDALTTALREARAAQERQSERLRDSERAREYAEGVERQRFARVVEVEKRWRQTEEKLREARAEIEEMRDDRSYWAARCHDVTLKLRVAEQALLGEQRAHASTDAKRSRQEARAEHAEQRVAELQADWETYLSEPHDVFVVLRQRVAQLEEFVRIVRDTEQEASQPSQWIIHHAELLLTPPPVKETP